MTWLIAAGGTGGHVFPALSVAQALRRLHPQWRVIFLGTKGGLEERYLSSKGYPFRAIHASGIVGKELLEKLRAVSKIPLALFQCLGVLLSTRPSVVLGMGGFASGPAVLSAAMCGIPTAIAEQNAVAGRTNRILGRFARKVFVHFPQSSRWFPSGKVRVTGNPVRERLVEAAKRTPDLRWEGGRADTLHLLIFGGSQGAAAINRLMLEALPRFRYMPFGVDVLHQARMEDIEVLKRGYLDHEIPHRVVPFIHDMEDAYAWAHLVVCRAGASSLAEIALFRRPSILIPFPHAADDHQRANAMVFQREGAALCLDQYTVDGQNLAMHIEALGRDPIRLTQMAKAAGSLAVPDAAERVVRECEEMITKVEEAR